MRPLSIALTATLAVATGFAAAARADETEMSGPVHGPYLGAGWGRFNLKPQNISDVGSGLVDTTNSHGDAFKITAGYRFMPYFALEANYIDFGMQNSRGFRALKVWTALRQAGRDGYLKMIGDDIRLAQYLYSLVAAHSELEALSCGLSIVTCRYVPADLRQRVGSAETEEYLNRLNKDILSRIETSGEAFLSNNVTDDKFELRVCFVNFRTSVEDVEALPELIVRIGRGIDAESRTKARLT